MSIPTTVEELTNLFDKVVEDPKVTEHLLTGAQSIATVLSSILLTQGQPGWHVEVNKVLGSNVLNESNAATLQPVVDFINKLADASPKQNVREALPSQQSGGAPKKYGNQWAGIGIDDAYGIVVDKVKGVNYVTRQFAKESGILRMEIDSDTKEDWHPFKPFEATINTISLPFLPFLGTALAQIPVPFRLIVYLGHSFLSLLRIMTSRPGKDQPTMRKVFSIALAAVDLLRGNWKGSLLSLAGYFGQNQMYMGITLKMFLNIFSYISPKLQEAVAWNLLKLTKSAIIGFLLKLFQITATKPVRDKVIELFTELAQRKNCLDLVLTKAGLPRRAPNTSPMGAGEAMAQMGRVQDFAQDEARNCSDEFRKVIAVARDSIILKLILQLMNVPVTEDNLDENCKKFSVYMKREGYSTWYELLVAEGILHQLTDLHVLETDPEAAELIQMNNRIIAIQKEIAEKRKEADILKGQITGVAPMPSSAPSSMPSSMPSSAPPSMPSPDDTVNKLEGAITEAEAVTEELQAASRVNAPVEAPVVAQEDAL